MKIIDITTHTKEVIFHKCVEVLMIFHVCVTSLLNIIVLHVMHKDIDENGLHCFWAWVNTLYSIALFCEVYPME